MSCFFSSRRRHTRCAIVTGVQTCALPLLAAATSIRDHTGWRERCEGCEVTRRKAIDNPPVPFGVERKELGAALKKFANLHADVGFPLAAELVRHRAAVDQEFALLGRGLLHIRDSRILRQATRAHPPGKAPCREEGGQTVLEQ